MACFLESTREPVIHPAAVIDEHRVVLFGRQCLWHPSEISREVVPEARLVVEEPQEFRANGEKYYDALEGPSEY